MRWRFWSRPRFVPEPDVEEIRHGHPAEGVALAALESPHAFRVGSSSVLRGWLSYDSPETRARLDATLEPLDVSWFFERIDGRTRVTVTHPAAPALPPEWPWNLVAFALTAVRGIPEPASVRAARAGVALPPAFDGWFERATHPDLSRRFTSSVQAVTELAHALSVPLAQRPPSSA